MFTITPILIFLCIIGNTCSTGILSSSLHRDQTTGAVFYTVSVFLGTQVVRHRLVVDFNDDKISTVQYLSLVSGTYSSLDGGSDIIMVSGLGYRLPVQHLATSDPVRQLCSSCTGKMGFRKDSLVWRLWPTMTFSMGSITLGGYNMAFSAVNGCPSFTVPCNTSDMSSICTTSAIVEDEVSLVKLTTSYKTIVPTALYDEFIIGMNVYETQQWRDILIRILDTSLGGHVPDDFEAPQTTTLFAICATYPYISIDAESFISTLASGYRSIWIQPTPNDTFSTIGINALSDTLIYVDSVNDFIVMKIYDHHDHVNGLNLLFFAVLFWTFIRWKMTDTNLKPSETVKIANHNLVIVIYMLVVMTVAFYSALIPSNRRILRDYWEVDIGVFAITCFEVVGIVASWVAFMTMNGKHQGAMFRINFTKDLLMEHMLLTSLWLLLLERRGDGLSNVPIFAIAVLITYNLSFYWVVLFTYFIYTGSGIITKHPIFTVFTAFYMPVVYGFHLYIGFVYFANPVLMDITSHIGPDMSMPVYVMILALIINAALYVTAMTERKAMKLAAEELSEKKGGPIKL